jgi:hypothetical protein
MEFIHRRTARQSETRRLHIGSSAWSSAKHARRDTHPASGRPLREAVRTVQRLDDLPIAHVPASSTARLQDTLYLQFQECASEGISRDAESLGELPFGREPVARSQDVGLDIGFETMHDPQVGELVAGGVEAQVVHGHLH